MHFVFIFWPLSLWRILFRIEKVLIIIKIFAQIPHTLRFWHIFEEKNENHVRDFIITKMCQLEKQMFYLSCVVS